MTAVLITILFACFAYKNLGAIEATAEERQAIRSAFKDYPAYRAERRLTSSGSATEFEPTLTAYDIAGARYFHVVCDLLTIAYPVGQGMATRKRRCHAER